MLKKILWGAGLAIVALVVVFLGVLGALYVFSVATGDEYTYDQFYSWLAGFGAIGTWLAGLATVGAVVVALKQSNQIRVQANNDAAAARSRLTDERIRHQIAELKADERLSNELDAARRSEQIQAVGPLIGAIADFRDETQNLLVAHQFYRLHPSSESSDSLDASKERQRQSSARFEATISVALMSVYEPHTSEVVRSIYKDFLKVKRALMQALQNKPNAKPDYQAVLNLLRALESNRMPLRRAVRDNLAPLQPASAEDNPDQLMLW